MPSKEVLLQEIQDLRSKEASLMIGEVAGVVVILLGMVMLFYTTGLVSPLRTVRSIGEFLWPFVAPLGVVFAGTGILLYSAYTSSKCQVRKSQLMKQLESMTPSCPKCGKEVSPEFNVCPYCGEKLKS